MIYLIKAFLTAFPILVLSTLAMAVELTSETSDICGDRPPIPYPQGELVPASCEGLPQVNIYTSAPEETAPICEGVQRAYDFFGELGRTSQRTIDVVVAPRAPEHREQQGYDWNSVYGYVDTDDLRLYLPPASLAIHAWKSGLMETPVTMESYISVVTHESAHILSQHFYARSCTLIAREQQEFIAYAAQISMMEPALQRKVLENFAAKNWVPFNKDKEIDPFYHLMNPHGFAVKSYLYFQTDSGNRYFEKVLAGEIAPIRLPRF